MIKFSFIVPCYNVEKYLRQCLDSLFAQDYSEFDIIAVDDGSSDKTIDILNEYSASHNNLKVLQQKNQGASVARNNAVKNSDADFIVFIDSDDYISSASFLSDLVANITENNSDVVLYKYSKFFDGEDDKAVCPFNFPTEFTDNLLLDLVRADAFYCAPWAKSVNRSFLADNNIEFKAGVVCEDQDWFLKIISFSPVISFIDKSYIMYRQRKNSVSSSNFEKSTKDGTDIIEEWSGLFSSVSDTKLKEGGLNAIAKLYCNIIIAYSRLTSKQPQTLSKLKELTFLFNYDANDRVKKMGKMYKFLGFNGMVFILKLIQKLGR